MAKAGYPFRVVGIAVQYISLTIPLRQFLMLTFQNCQLKTDEIKLLVEAVDDTAKYDLVEEEVPPNKEMYCPYSESLVYDLENIGSTYVRNIISSADIKATNIKVVILQGDIASELNICSLKAVALWKPVSVIPTTDSDLQNSNKFSVHVPLLKDCHTTKERRYPGLLDTCINEFSDEENEDFQAHKLRQEEVQTLSVIVDIQKGCVVMHSPLMNCSQKLSPKIGSRMVFQVEDCTVFAAPSYNGNTNESYLRLLSNKAAMYHNGYTSLPNDISDFKGLANVGDLQPVLYNSEIGILANSGMCCKTGRDGLDMLAVSVHVTHDDKKNTKNLRVAAQLQGATLRHCPSATMESWHTQLMNFIGITDNSSNGLHTSSTVADLHLHFDHCAVDYRPLHLPFHVVITTKSLDFPNVLASALPPRIIAEELCLYLSGNTAVDFVDLRNYVCVAETGVLEMSLSVTSEESLVQPKVKLVMSNDVIHIRTCVDSGQALLSLIGYVANNGDCPPDLTCPGDQESYPKREPLLDVPDEDIESLIADAMMECPSSSDFSPKKEEEEDFVKVGFGIAREFYDSVDAIDDLLRSLPSENVLKAPENFPESLSYYLVQTSIVWKLYEGSDLQSFEENDSLNSSSASCRVPDEMIRGFTDCSTTIGDGDSLFGTEYYESFYSTESDSHSWRERGGKNRNHRSIVEFHIKKMQFQHEEYGSGEYASRNVLAIENIEILDRLVISDMNKFLHQYTDKPLKHMLVVEALYFQPYAGQHGEECELKVSATSMKLNIDQDTILFLTSFFGKLFSSSEPGNVLEDKKEKNCRTSAPCIDQTFIKSFTFCEDVTIRLDYTGKQILFSQGIIPGILLGLTELSGSEIKLKSLFNNRGLLGHRRLVHYVIDSWIEDIKNNQLASLLYGIGPVDPLIRLATGIKDLFWLPVEEVCNEGDIITGLKKGTASFLSSSPVAALELTCKVIGVTEDAARVTCDILSPGLRPDSRRKRIHHPSDFRDGVIEAWETVKNGFCSNTRSVACSAATEHRHKGLPGALGCLVREVPGAFVRTVVSGAEASKIVLGSARNHICPNSYKELKNKFKK